jgi:hypothetical protein
MQASGTPQAPRHRIPRSVRILLWVAVFVGAAGIGAFIGAHSNPFPPEVQGPPATTPSNPAVAKPIRWRGAISSVTAHQLYVGGSCRTDWTTALTFTVDTDGTISGQGRARLKGKLRCDFSTAQIDTRSFVVKVSGTLTGAKASLRLTEIQRSPAGTSDLGGFASTVLTGARSTLTVPLDATSTAARGRVDLHRIDQEGRGTFSSSNLVRLTCLTCPTTG